MSKDLRKFERSEVTIEVALRFLEDTACTVVTRDVSEGGLFMRLENPSHYPLGEMVNLKFPDPLQANSPTEKDAIIVRCTDNGIAVAFIEIDGF